MGISTIKSGTLGGFNVGLSLAVGFLIPLGAQIDALIAFGLGPLQVDLNAQLSASLSFSAGLSISIGNPFAGIQAVLTALANIQAALALALQFQLPAVQVSLQLSVALAFQAALAIQIGALQLAISLALSIKIPALKAAAALAASINAGPVFAFMFDSDTLEKTGADIEGLFSNGLIDGANVIQPTDPVFGIVMLSSVPSVQASFDVLFQV